MVIFIVCLVVADKRCALKVKAHIVKGMLPLGMQRLVLKWAAMHGAETLFFCTCSLAALHAHSRYSPRTKPIVFCRQQGACWCRFWPSSVLSASSVSCSKQGAMDARAGLMPGRCKNGDFHCLLGGGRQLESKGHIVKGMLPLGMQRLV